MPRKHHPFGAQRLSRSLLGMIAAILLAQLPQPAAATYIEFDAQNRPIEVRDLIVGPATYDFSILYNTSFQSIWGLPSAITTNAPPFWGNAAGAQATAIALRDALRATGNLLAPNFTVVEFPYQISSGENTNNYNTSLFFISGVAPLNWYQSTDNGPGNASECCGWAVFPPAEETPTPGSLALLLGALGMLVLVRRFSRTADRDLERLRGHAAAAI